MILAKISCSRPGMRISIVPVIVKQPHPRRTLKALLDELELFPRSMMNNALVGGFVQ
jgi:hypothetical protein